MEKRVTTNDSVADSLSAFSSTLEEKKIEHATVSLPPMYNYIGVFLTFRCPFNCSYCINRFGETSKLTAAEITGKEWIDFFNRLIARDIPITLQGGEPGCHPDFLDIVRETAKTHLVDILTTLSFDLRNFVRHIEPSSLNREAPYAPIRISYHPEQFSLNSVINKAKFLQNAGFRVGIYGVMHPSQIGEMKHAESVCSDLGIDFRTKPFLGFYNGMLSGQYAYPDACALQCPQTRECAPSELLLAPDGTIYPCHHHLYNQINSSGHINDKYLYIADNYKTCHYYGHCNPCDVKIKNNRFQQFGHVAARIRRP